MLPSVQIVPEGEFDFELLLSHLGLLLLAYLLAIPIAWNREREERSAGLRTFPLVAVSSCAFVLIARTAFLTDDPNAMARVLQGVITGIGFIGGGAILKERGHVEGTATAASIWGTGAVGAAVGFARYEIAVVLSLVTCLTFFGLTPLKSRVD